MEIEENACGVLPSARKAAGETYHESNHEVAWEIPD
jgi:hypothetical protein